jgi:hypothetical protein
MKKIKFLAVTLLSLFSFVFVANAQDSDFPDDSEMAESTTTVEENSTVEKKEKVASISFNPYTWFDVFYGSGLSHWLNGECNQEMFNEMAVNGVEVQPFKTQLECNNHISQYSLLSATMGCFTFLLSLLIVVFYYFVINKPSWNTLLHWSGMLLLNSILSMVIAYFMCGDAVKSCWTYSYDSMASVLSQVGTISILPVVVSNAFIAALFFLFWSFILKRFKAGTFISNCRNTPWITKWPN